MHYLLIYDAVDQYESRRALHRAAHLAHAWAAHARGELLLGGATGSPADGAVLWFQGDSPAAAEQFARTDPYVLNGLISHWRVVPWMTVVGDLAVRMVRPEDL